MIQITADVFSGRPNPSWIVKDETEARAVLKELGQNRDVVSSGAPAGAGLGLRGFLVEALTDEAVHGLDIPTSLYLEAGPSVAGSKAADLIERLIGMMNKAEAPTEAADAATVALGESLQSFLRGQLELSGRASVADVREAPGASPEAADKAKAETVCSIELAAYNPGFWNTNPTILRGNNCYNYASNKRTDTFAQPGRGCGHMYTAITCQEVTRAALCDGLHRRFDCFPPAEAPRYLVALVVAPGPGFVDFHWYRKMKEGFWGHKPGSTQVRNVDNSGRIIADPATCDRGPYSQFCGYFYTCRSQRIR